MEQLRWGPIPRVLGGSQARRREAGDHSRAIRRGQSSRGKYRETFQTIGRLSAGNKWGQATSNKEKGPNRKGNPEVSAKVQQTAESSSGTQRSSCTRRRTWYNKAKVKGSHQARHSQKVRILKGRPQVKRTVIFVTLSSINHYPHLKVSILVTRCVTRKSF